MYGTTIDTALIGKKITRVFANQSYLRFITIDGESFTYSVDADCCSTSVFYDFIGVKKLLENGAVISVKDIELLPSDVAERESSYGTMKESDKNVEMCDESISCYGFEIVTTSPEFGEQTSVFSFRNYSNGYYGVSLCDSTYDGEIPELFDDTTHISAE